MAFGTMSADVFESSSNRSPELAVLFYATGDDHAGKEVERLIRTAAIKPEFDPTDPGRPGYFQWAGALGVRSQKWPRPR
jgi:hypothetical protein